MLKRIAVVALLSVLLAPVAHTEEKWVSLFNGKNLDGWTAKIKGYPLGENFGNTFRVEDGVIKVSYDQYDKFDKRYGHLFYKTPYSNYRLRMEYRFTGEQCPGGEGWAFRNSGAMIHCQPPETMGLNQDFPVSIEVQFLGGKSDGRDRPTCNLCTPGTNVEKRGKLVTRHCINSKSHTFDGDQWVSMEVEVHGDKHIIHKVDGESVIDYGKPQYDPTDKDAKAIIKDGDLTLSSGYISVQSESHPVEFRNIEILVLD
jgi:3-keto-disaccharide hydrolase